MSNAGLSGVNTPPLWPAQMAHSVGVTHEPEIAEFDLAPRNDVMLVLATDGVWDVLSVEDIRRVGLPNCQREYHLDLERRGVLYRKVAVCVHSGVRSASVTKTPHLRQTGVSARD